MAETSEWREHPAPVWHAVRLPYFVLFAAFCSIIQTALKLILMKPRTLFILLAVLLFAGAAGWGIYYKTLPVAVMGTARRRRAHRPGQHIGERVL
jgi:hypothetical protein